jgi:hypothetical protein
MEIEANLRWEMLEDPWKVQVHEDTEIKVDLSELQRDSGRYRETLEERERLRETFCPEKLLVVNTSIEIFYPRKENLVEIQGHIGAKIGTLQRLARKVCENSW